MSAASVGYNSGVLLFCRTDYLRLLVTILEKIILKMNLSPRIMAPPSRKTFLCFCQAQGDTASVGPFRSK